MRRLFLLSLMLLIGVLMKAESQFGWVYLNNGNIVKGEISTTETHVKIIDENGREFEYPMVEINRISYTSPVMPNVGKDPTLVELSEIDRGFWFSPQLSASYALFLKDKCTPWSELDLTGGYRFSQYLKAGLGIGCRWYLDNDNIRKCNVAVSFPIYATIRGNIIEETYRNFVPYYSFDIGGVVRDGFMWRPTIGLRVGQKRSAFLVGISYTGQTLKYVTDKNRYVSALGIVVGYEY